MKFENTSVCNFENAFRGMRNPLDSWNKSDSFIRDGCFIAGEADLGLACRLIRGGSEHRKFLRQIFVSVDITAPIYWWSEYDTYKVGTAANSCSTMHTLSRRPVTADMLELDDPEADGEYLSVLLEKLEELRLMYKETSDIQYFRRMKQLLPSSFLQKRTCTMNYENLLSMIHQRSHHRLREWSVLFIEWAHTLPYADELLFGLNEPAV